jgi:hypothetical protein
MGPFWLKRGPHHRPWELVQHGFKGQVGNFTLWTRLLIWLRLAAPTRPRLTSLPTFLRSRRRARVCSPAGSSSAHDVKPELLWNVFWNFLLKLPRHDVDVRLRFRHGFGGMVCGIVGCFLVLPLLGTTTPRRPPRHRTTVYKYFS